MTPNTVRHTIRLQYLHVEVNGTESDALALQNRLSRLSQDWLMPALERVFDHCVPADENWFIERLKIDAGTLNIDSLEQDLADIVAKAVEKTIQEQITISVDQLVAETKNVQRKTSHQTIDEAFIYFLQTGRLPWAFHLPKDKSLESMLLVSWNQSDRNYLYLENTVRNVLAVVIPRKRLLRQFSADFLQTLLTRLDSESSKAILAILPILNSADAPAADVKLFIQQLWETVFAFIATGKAITVNQLVTESLKTLPISLSSSAKLANLLERHWPGSIAPSKLSPAWFFLINQKLIQTVLQALDNADLATFTRKQFEYYLRQTISTVRPTNQTLTEYTLVKETWQNLPVTLQQAELASLLERHWSGSTSAINLPPSLFDSLSLANQKVMQTILQVLNNSSLADFIKNQFEHHLWQIISAVRPSDQTLTAYTLVTETSHSLPATLQQPALTSLLERHWPGSTPASDLQPPKLSLANQKLTQTVLQVLNNSSLADLIKKQFEHHLWQIIYAVKPSDQRLTAYALVRETWQSLPAISQQTALKNLLEHHWLNVTQSVNQYEITVNKAESIPSALIDAKEGIYIENAGLILLHPFLPQFLKALGLVTEDLLLQPERAICLLHFMVTGQTVAPEYELILSKILCNMPLETPIESDMALTDAEKAEAEALLEAVIQHWDALRNTSIDGLRGTFLLRLGKLSLRDDGDWLLQVESKTVDILLNHLPWGISMIQLPWMQRMLWVEWAS
ncbi:contractile injection system tape measure protein [Methylobacter psychrophilus]|uniref:contractile injection system tape measure protein n=1 Tax=Methylobacter psychrophilus TaxID=96941 RepID=UPI0021D4AD6D|nr:contractile injection system tape measure protein [Methylobacter psychrophilus]